MAPSAKASCGWLPHLAGGASVWRLVDDLNAPDLMDGHLLVPRVRGPAELPDEVQWNLTGLVPLRRALDASPEDVRIGFDSLWAGLDRTQARFELDGYEDFEDAFTLPPVELDDGAHYFWNPEERKVLVRNWGASPRGPRRREIVVFDRLHWRDLRRGAETLVGAHSTSSPPASPAPIAPAAGSRRVTLVLAVALILALAIAAAARLGPEPDDARAPPPAPSPLAPPPPAPRPPPEAPAPPIPRPHQTILFALGRAHFDESQRASLEAIRAYLETHAHVTRLRIEGHADYLGLEHENQPLSRDRAQRVAQWLVDHGIDRHRLAPVGCSERYPLDRAESAEARRRNRRVEFFVLEPPGVDGPPPHPRCAP